MLVTETSAITHNVDKESCNVTTVNQVTGITYPVVVVIYNCFIHHVICGIAKLLQVIHFNTICLQNEVLYEFIDDQNGILQ